MEALSVEQSEQLKIWSSQRDTIVADLHINTEKNNVLISENKNLINEKKDLENKISEYKKLLSQKDGIVAEINRLTPIIQELTRTNTQLNELILSGKETVNLKSWVGQRDEILNKIAENRKENEDLIIKNNNLASSNTELTNRIQQSTGRILEIEKKEEERAGLITIHNSGLINEKSILQTEVFSLKSEVSALNLIKENLHNDIVSITKIHEAVFARTGDIQRIVENTVGINSKNTQEIKNILIEAGIQLKNIIDIASENVEKTNKAIIEIPKIIVDLHKDVIEKREFNRHKNK